MICHRYGSISPEETYMYLCCSEEISIVISSRDSEHLSLACHQLQTNNKGSQITNLDTTAMGA